MDQVLVESKGNENENKSEDHRASRDRKEPAYWVNDTGKAVKK